MTPYRVVAIPEAVAQAVRATGKSPQYGHPAHTEVATGSGPCRQCLRAFVVGSERRILFTYDPFEETDPFPLPGPVFIHEAPCERYPENDGLPEYLRGQRLTLNAYGRGRVLRAQERVADESVEPTLEHLLGRPDVDYIHIRSTEAGCYGFRVERR